MKNTLSELQECGQLKKLNEDMKQLIGAVKEKLRKLIMFVYEDENENREQLEQKFRQIGELTIKQQLTYLYQMIKYCLKDYKELQI